MLPAAAVGTAWADVGSSRKAHAGCIQPAACTEDGLLIVRVLQWVHCCCPAQAEPCHVDSLVACSAAICTGHGLLVQHLLLWLQLCKAAWQVFCCHAHPCDRSLMQGDWSWGKRRAAFAMLLHCSMAVPCNGIFASCNQLWGQAAVSAAPQAAQVCCVSSSSSLDYLYLHLLMFCRWWRALSALCSTCALWGAPTSSSAPRMPAGRTLTSCTGYWGRSSRQGLQPSTSLTPLVSGRGGLCLVSTFDGHNLGWLKLTRPSC